MYPMMTPAQLIGLSLKTGTMLAEAQMVIGMRMLGLMGLWRVAPSENARMSSEKLAALSQSAIATSQAVLTGKPPALIAEAALKPIRRRTRSNVKRLACRGPGQP
ncbi:antifreeze protein [Tabrizicola sp.]|uniref:antifreeze protein n=1 Tax=Tabrizicola sp. TaxID=2005166 RepID=UPI002FDEBB83